ncbi:MAG: phosphohydrolase [Deltaproteobacteria bacterium RBG_13_43_22]|nr:MAG: phosphohydrolase [Deltaproteobacteria bacterium RBG_13_43_22]
MKCPGQDSRYWKPGSIFGANCPQCGQEMEFFKDDTTRRCKNCGYRLLNPKMDFGCASYCQYAEQCLGDLPPELIAQKEDLLKDRVAIEMKKYFGKDFRRIGHATKVARYAEQIGKSEKGNLAVILPAAYLHDIGIHEAERKYQSTAARYQEELGPPMARTIMMNLGARSELIEEVCDIVGHHHHPRTEETNNYKAIYDADLIVNLEEAQKEKTTEPERTKQNIEKSFLTESGRKLAREVLLQPVES